MAQKREVAPEEGQDMTQKGEIYKKSKSKNQKYG